MGSAHMLRKPSQGEIIRHRVMIHGNERDKINKNVLLLKAGLINERKSDIKAESYVLEAYNPSPTNRVLTEYELLGALVKNDSA